LRSRTENRFRLLRCIFSMCSARFAISLLLTLTLVSSECAYDDCATKDGESSDEANLLQSRISFGEDASIDLHGFTSVGQIVPRLLEQNKKCTNQVDLRTVGAWRYGQNETGAGDLSKCALLVHEVGANFGCLSGNFHFTIDSGIVGLSGCGCATTDHCTSRSTSPGWNVYTLTSYTELPGGQKLGVDANRHTHFPLAPENVPKIWDTKSSSSFKVVETSDCGEGYVAIMNVDECRRAGNSLNIEPWSFQWLPLFNAICTFAWYFPPAFFQPGDIEFEVPVFDPGCLVAPGRDRGKRLAFFDNDVLLFNKANAAQFHHDSVFVKHRICKKEVE